MNTLQSVSEASVGNTSCHWSVLASPFQIASNCVRVNRTRSMNGAEFADGRVGLGRVRQERAVAVVGEVDRQHDRPDRAGQHVDDALVARCVGADVHLALAGRARRLVGHAEARHLVAALAAVGVRTGALTHRAPAGPAACGVVGHLREGADLLAVVVLEVGLPGSVRGVRERRPTACRVRAQALGPW